MISVLDGDSLIFTIFHPNKVLDEKGEPLKQDGKFVYIEKTEEEIIESANSLMKSILTKGRFSGYIGFIKGKGNYRYSIDPEYKNNRPKESPKWWNFVKQYLIDKYCFIEVNGIEVDDAVNITRLSNEDYIATAIDKDILGLEGLHYNWRKDEWVTISKSQAEYKFWCDMICGQSGDNIKGLIGKGIKYAERLLKDVETYPDKVLKAYIEQLGDKVGISEFYKNYNCLLILDSYEGFEIPNVI